MGDILKFKPSNCKNCYKCIRNCPVKAISFTGEHAQIVSNDCILCGQCFVACPQNAKEIIDETAKVRNFINDGEKVIASIAPSFIANYDGVGILQMESALKKLGFFAVEETALGATMVKKEYERILMEEKPSILISSCCSSVNKLIETHYPDALRYLANVVTPMVAHCNDIKMRHPDCKTVFIGPCVAKKDEVDKCDGAVDVVLTFEDLTKWLKRESVVLDKEMDVTTKSRARLFPTAGGVINTMDCPKGYTYLAVDGLDNCITALEDILNGGISDCFVEMNTCKGACIHGPIMEKQHNSPVRDYAKVVSYAGEEDFEVNKPDKSKLNRKFKFVSVKKQVVPEEKIKEILKKMGKRKPEDELNCGTCGYNTCREKAEAVYFGKADTSMCLPHLMERAQSFSDTIINNMPNGVLVLNDKLEVQQINKSARKLLNVRYATDVLNEPVVRILDPKDFIEVRGTGRNIYDKSTYLAEYKKYVEETVIQDKDNNVLICLLKDLTDVEEQKEKKTSISRQTIETADEVVDRQMRTVQEIAYLLGETAAETKIALGKLKESLSDE